MYKDQHRGTRAIAKYFGVSRSAVQSLIHKYQETGSTKSREGQGRKRKLSTVDVRRIKRKALSGKSATTIAREESERHADGVSDRTVRDTIRNTGLKYLSYEEREEFLLQIINRFLRASLSR